MRIPLDWLREFVPVPAEHRAEDVMADLVRVGLEEEDVHRPAAELQGPIVVGQVLSKEPEPQKNGKTINWCSVRVVPEGAAQPLTGEGIEPSGVQGIVCGAHNFEVGDKVVVTLPGAVLPGDFRISPRKTYGHVSAGMIASSTELGMGDDGTDGIVVLGDLGLDPELGTDARDVLDLHGEAAEINVTPDRGYAFSMRGVAREYAHATGVPFTDPAAAIHPPAADDAGPAVRIDDDAPIHGEPGATRFVARTVSGVDATRPTPPWLAARLRLAGIRTISLPVDISNYVMWELGQPLHFYDADTLSGEIVVRRAQVGETLTTLDGKERELDPEDLLITDDSGPIGLAGVMGGAATEVTDATTTFVVESANFDPVSIARTRRRHRLPSEASKRNERGVDWEVADEAAERAVQLLVELAGGTAEPGVTDVGTRPEPAVVEMAADFPSALVGVAYTTDEVVETLRALGAEVAVTEAADGAAPRLTVTAPSWRTDLRIPEDLAEEVARLRGYDAIPSVVPVAPPGRGFTRRQAQRRRVSAALAAAGLSPRCSPTRSSPKSRTGVSGRTRTRRARPWRWWPWPIRSPPSTGTCACRCCRASSRPRAATSAAASATWRCTRWGWSSCPALSWARRRSPRARSTPPPRSSPTSRPASPPSRGTWPVCTPGTTRHPGRTTPRARWTGRTRSPEPSTWPTSSASS